MPPRLIIAVIRPTGAGKTNPKTGKPWTSAQDAAADKRAGIKPGSARDNALDRRRGVRVKKGKS